MAALADLGRLQSWRTLQATGYATLSEAGAPQQAPPQDAEGRFVLLDVDGPGCVTRIWGVGMTGNLMVWIDGEPKPRLNAPWSKLAYSWWDALRYQKDKSAVDATAIPPFLCPLADGTQNIQIVTVPLGFQKHCKIATDQAPPRNQYCLDYTLAPGAPVTSFLPTQFQPDQPPLQDLLHVWREPGDFFVTDPAWKQASDTSYLSAGQTVRLLQAPGAGQVRLLVVDLPQATVLGGRWCCGGTGTVSRPRGWRSR